ncbi:MAG: nitrate reductase molybdenum cofactor assembly chaperone [Proteobacteria bacterium]|nr:nitrate reductase molybdenum cofactor assembly chaperone [Pseudomonadota bacterium]
MTMQVFKAFSALLSYPSAEMRQALPEITGVICASGLIGPGERASLLELIGEIGEGDVLTAEERYVDLFDRGRALSLHLFEHLHGEGRDRGTAMVELKNLYSGAGFDLATSELPDFLPVVLEYLAQRELSEARELLLDCKDILAAICRGLLARQSSYAAVLQALLVMAGEQPLDASAVKPVQDLTDTLDDNWAERPAFADAAMFGGAPP